MRPITLISALAATLYLLLCGPALAAGWTWPVRGPVITPYRNGDDPYAAGQHRGIDVGAPVGSRVVAAVGGTVTFVGVVGSSGLTVSERTADGRFDLSYLHLSAASVHRGEPVSEGAAVGAVGTSGRRSVEAPHLHFGVRDAGSRTAYRDPLDFLAPPPSGGRRAEPRPGAGSRGASPRSRRPSPAPAPAPAAAPCARTRGRPLRPGAGPSRRAPPGCRSTRWSLGCRPEARPDARRSPSLGTQLACEVHTRPRVGRWSALALPSGAHRPLPPSQPRLARHTPPGAGTTASTSAGSPRASA